MKRILTFICLFLFCANIFAQRRLTTGMYKLDCFLDWKDNEIPVSKIAYKYITRYVILSFSDVEFEGDTFRAGLDNNDFFSYSFMGRKDGLDRKMVYDVTSKDFKLAYVTSYDVYYEKYTKINGSDGIIAKKLYEIIEYFSRDTFNSDHKYAGTWHRRGLSSTPYTGTRVKRANKEEYVIRDEGKSLRFFDDLTTGNSRQMSGNIVYCPYAYISKNEYQEDGITHYIFWIDENTYSDSFTMEGKLNIEIWDRSGLPSSYQGLFETDNPQSDKYSLPIID